MDPSGSCLKLALLSGFWALLNENGDPIFAFVVLYGHPDQRRILELAKDRLEFERFEQLELLVRARGPVPPNIEQRIRDASSRWGWTTYRQWHEAHARQP